MRTFQCAEGGATLLVHTAMNRTRETLPAALLPLKLYLFQPLPKRTNAAVTPFTPDPAISPARGPEYVQINGSKLAVDKNG